jgi:RNA polymerase sigma factor for flagellar operon FliA
MVRSIASGIARSSGGLMPVDDLLSIGVQALLEVAERFDHDHGTRFSTFAYWRIRGAMLDGISRYAPLPRGIHRSNRAGRGRPRRHVGPFDEAVHLVEPSAEPPDPGDAIDAERRARKVRDALERLPTRKRALLRRHYFGDESLLDIGRSMGLSKSWASRLHSQSLDELRAVLREVA